MKFNELNLTSDLMRGIEEADFTDCTPVQEKTFKLVLEEGRDATVQSQTGTGKTAAFLISIFEIFERASREPDGGHRHAALVVVPTRELAVQVADEAKLLGKYLSYRIGSVFGGVGYGEQEKLLQQGADIIIGTPGRLLDFSSSGKLDFKGFDILVLDEADRMLDMGFLPDVRRILKALPPASQRKTLLFSATLATRVKNLAWEHMNNPGEIEVAPEHITVEEITQELYHVTRADKLKLLLGLLEREKPDNALIFTNMKSTAVDIAKRLSHNGLPSEYIMGDLPQRKRLNLIEGIKEGKIRFLVATDVAARGLHINDLDLVVNYDVPEDYELYVHRIGRTARAGKSGKAITLACERYVYGLEAIESFIGQKIPVVWPDESLFKDDASAGMRFSDRYADRGQSRDRRTGKGGSSRSGRPRSPSRDRSPARRSGSHQRDGRSSDRAAANGTPPDSSRSGPRPKGPRSGKPGPKSRPQVSGERHAPAPDAAKPSANAPIEDRLSYYREKYGEDFQMNRVRSGETTRSGRADDRKDRNSGSRRNGSNGGKSGGSGKHGRSDKPVGPAKSARGGGPPKPDKSTQSGGSGGAERPRPSSSKSSKSEKPPRTVETNSKPQDPGIVSKLKRLFKRQ